ncbi:uncharacterized protein N7482_006868 [Penicillium canariense]|uniref:Uncharacterized protein n=1 Tax=Penicillium canariense TaxID=189055 RepID=A0A9W9HX35_9EURO|nr:uncharacterized protein N7482_006868 [Penicillium canariense]KAJ5159864.1 hypothetical protein N7482_006868 [Penicillium canariense]
MSTVYSQAFNFSSFLQQGVDPRTGQFTAAIALYETPTKTRNCVPLQLSIAYNPMVTQDIGLGKGWTFNLSTYQQGTNHNTLLVSTGENYQINEKSSSVLVKDQKLKSFRFEKKTENNIDQYRIFHKSGAVEVLRKLRHKDHVAVPFELYAPNGRMLNLDWAPSGEQVQLSKIQDGSQVLLEISYNPGQVTVTRSPGTEESSTITLLRRNGQLTEVQLPLQDNPSWKLTYATFEKVLCLTKIINPAGMVEEVTYPDQGGHQLPRGAPYTAIPYVLSHTMRPGNEQPSITETYKYSPKNFLGYSGGFDWQDGVDNLYNTTGNYEFWTSVKVDTGAYTKYTYNRFHLLVSSQRKQGTKQLTQTVTYHMNVTGDFSKQPANYLLPKVVETRYEDTDTKAFRTETSQHKFDDWGNPLQDIQPNGVTTDRVYYPPEGEGGLCPADPYGFQRYTKTVTMTPADSPYRTPTRSRHYTYDQWPTATSTYAQYFVAVRKEQTLEDGKEVSSTEYSYLNQTGSRDHGRRQQQTVYLSGQYPMTYSWTYQYPKNTDQFAETVQTKTYDGYRIEAQTVFSLSSGLTLSQTDPSTGVQANFQYDPIGRLLKKTISGGTPYESVQSYEYIFMPQNRTGYCVTSKNPKGVATRQFTDGLERLYRVEKQDDDGEYPATGTYDGTFRTVEARQYNAVGQCIEVTTTDWLRAIGEQPQQQQVTKSMEYDDWGQIFRVTGSDGVVTLTQGDPIAMTHTQGIEGEAQTSTQFNIRGSPAQTSILAKDKSIYSEADYLYDGLGRLAEHKDPMGHTMQYQLDYFDRVTRTSWQQDELVMSTEYAPHSASPLPISTKIDGSTVVGTQVYDGLGRVTKQSLGSRVTTISYRGNKPKPEYIITPKGDRDDLVYDPNLGYAITADQSASLSNSFAYDKRTKEILQLDGPHSKEQRQYLPSGRLWQQQFTIENNTFSAFSSYSMAGKLQRYMDVNGQSHDLAYDEYGRPKGLTQGRVRVTFKYDEASRLRESQALDTETNESLTTRLVYDEFGRETERSASNGSELVHQISQTYGKTNLVLSRQVKDASERVLRNETYQYDSYDRLIDYQCRGIQPPADEQGNTLQRQQFTFDKHDNLVEIVTTFQDGSENTTCHSHRSDEPTQLIQITNTHPSYPAQIDLEYDANGCLTRDEQGRQLKYNSKNRLTAVCDAMGQTLSEYFYDASGKLIRQNVQGKDTYLFYRGAYLIAVRTADSGVSYISTGGVRWGQIVHSSQGSRTQLCASDTQQSVLAWLDPRKPGEIHHQEYTPYGFGALTTSAIGYTGQWRDPVTGWYHLGNGYRAYNPILMRFHSPDHWSPFKTGEVNPYAYCLGDPINRTDPSGHFSIFGIHLSWRDVALVAVGIGVGILVGVATGGMGFAIEAGIGIAAGVASDVVTGAAYDAASGKSPTWQSVGSDALFGAVGGALGEVGGKILGSGLKAATKGLGKVFSRSESTALGEVESRATRTMGPLAGPPRNGRAHFPRDPGLTNHTGEYIFLDSVDGVQGQEGFITHGDQQGFLYGRGHGAYANHIVQHEAGIVARNTIQHEMGLARQRLGLTVQQMRSLRRGHPFFLFACYGADSGAGQAVANRLERRVVAFSGPLDSGAPNITTLASWLEQRGGVLGTFPNNPWGIFDPVISMDTSVQVDPAMEID